jgi:hypothetical protein
MKKATLGCRVASLTVNNWRIPEQIESLPQPTKYSVTPLPRSRHVFAARKWSPLDVRYMPRGT